LNDPHVIAYCADDAAYLAAQRMAMQGSVQQQPLQKIARVLGAVDHWRELLSLLRTPREHGAYRQIREIVQRQMGEVSYLDAWKEGQSTSFETLILEAIQLLESSNQPEPKERRLPEGNGIAVALSERERQVLGLVAEGLSNQEIANQLIITERTVRFHVTSIFNKLGANNRAQAVTFANRIGIL
jgi:DNA-binding CsgD family transcriptional regulator